MSDHTERRRRTIRLINTLPVLRKEVDTVSILVHSLNQRRSNALVDLIHIEPELVRRLTLLVLHRINEPVNDQGIVVDHDHVRIHHLKVVVNLVESKPLLLRILVSSRIV